MDAAWFATFKEKLDKFYAWPALYTFKFIVPASQEMQLRQLFPMHTPSEKSSGQGKYISLTYQMMMPSGESVIAVYRKAAAIEGLIAL
ncbi:MAG TPA: DUF493 family protein [Cyclobacteriaceae bacterium]|nr:DUF493 family protein [Cyclobacteriaceae bacterium]